MKANAPDRLSLLRSKYVAEIRAKKAELEALQQKVALIDELETESSALSASMNRAPAGPYSSMGLTAAVWDSIGQISGAATVAQVKKQLLNNGFRPKGKNFTVSIAKTLNRLQGQRKLDTDLKDGRRRYWKANPNGRFEVVS